MPDETAVPQLVIIGGPNGAGKSTLAPYLLRDALGLSTFVNADDIARGLAGFAPELVAVRAGRIMLERLRDLVHDRSDFAFESTLAGLSAQNIIERCRDAGYRITLAYLWLPSAELAEARVRQRVLAGGHDIPTADIRRRWRRSLENLFDHYIPLSTTWRVYDAGAIHPLPEIARGGQGRAPTILDPSRWRAVQDQALHRRPRGDGE